MALQLKTGQDRFYEEHPRGTFAMTLCDVWDEGERDTTWGPKHDYRLSFLTSAKMADGRPFIISRWVRKSLGKGPKGPSYMVATFEALRNKEIEEFDLTQFEDEMELMESCIGYACLGTVTHKKGGDGKTRARVDTVVPLPAGMLAPNISADFKRKKDREGFVAEQTPQQKIKLLWATASDRSKALVGSDELKEEMVRDAYMAHGVGSTAQAVESISFEKILYDIRAWVPKDALTGAADECPF